MNLFTWKEQDRGYGDMAIRCYKYCYHGNSGGVYPTSKMHTLTNKSRKIPRLLWSLMPYLCVPCHFVIAVVRTVIALECFRRLLCCCLMGETRWNSARNWRFSSDQFSSRHEMSRDVTRPCCAVPRDLPGAVFHQRTWQGQGRTAPLHCNKTEETSTSWAVMGSTHWI